MRTLPVRGRAERAPINRLFFVGRNDHAHAIEMGKPVDKASAKRFRQCPPDRGGCAQAHRAAARSADHGRSRRPATLAVNCFVVLVAPRGVPAGVRNQIDADVRKALAGADLKARCDTFAFENIGWGPDQITAATAAKSRLCAELVKRKSISLE